LGQKRYTRFLRFHSLLDAANTRPETSANPFGGVWHNAGADEILQRANQLCLKKW
jgi:hypothetical protein